VGALVALLPLCPGGAGGQGNGLAPQERKGLESEARRLEKEAFAQSQRRNYQAAVRSLERALAMYERLYGKEDHPALAGSLNNLGVLLYELGQPARPAKALPHYERALAMRERLHPKQDHPELAHFFLPKCRPEAPHESG
jgi:tetratricopeptide (TPR) repeat protein